MRFTKIVILFAVFGLSSVQAGDQLLHSVEISKNGFSIAIVRADANGAVPTEVEIQDQAKLIIRSTRYGQDQIALDTKLYVFSGSEFTLQSEPRIIVNLGVPAIISTSPKNEPGYQFIITTGELQHNE